jgi:hypothetical protein
MYHHPLSAFRALGRPHNLATPSERAALSLPSGYAAKVAEPSRPRAALVRSSLLGGSGRPRAHCPRALARRMRRERRTRGRSGLPFSSA